MTTPTWNFSLTAVPQGSKRVLASRSFTCQCKRRWRPRAWILQEQQPAAPSLQKALSSTEFAHIRDKPPPQPFFPEGEFFNVSLGLKSHGGLTELQAYRIEHA